MKPTEKAQKCREIESEVRLGRLKNALGFNLRLAQEAAFLAFSNRVGDRDLKPRRYAMLTLIHENSGLTQAELGRASGREKSSITPALQDLIRRGLVSRRPSAKDRRVQTLWLTRKGVALLDKLEQHAEAHNEMLTALIGSGNRELFLELLARIITGCGRARRAGMSARPRTSRKRR